jgi:hypothetical protein
MLLLAGVAAVPAGLLWWLLPPLPVFATALLVLGIYGVIYLAASRLAGVEEAEAWLGGLARRLRRR